MGIYWKNIGIGDYLIAILIIVTITIYVVVLVDSNEKRDIVHWAFEEDGQDYRGSYTCRPLENANNSFHCCGTENGYLETCVDFYYFNKSLFVYP